MTTAHITGAKPSELDSICDVFFLALAPALCMVRSGQAARHVNPEVVENLLTKTPKFFLHRAGTWKNL